MGLGNTRRIVIGDTMLDRYIPDEIEVVLAHELGHHEQARHLEADSQPIHPDPRRLRPCEWGATLVRRHRTYLHQPCRSRDHPLVTGANGSL